MPAWIRRGLAAAAIAALAAVVSLVGCSPNGAIAPNAEPETNVFVQYDPADTLDHTVNHEVHLYWFGSDADGFVTAYDFRFLEPGGPTDPPWIRTTDSDSLFTMQVPTGTATPTFQVRAVDNDGAVDATPAQQQFSLENAAPVLVLADPPRSTDTTFATQSIAWAAIDPDGDASRIVYRVWLDGNEANPHVMSEEFFTFPSADFLRDGHYTAGPRTAYVQAYDAGGRASNLVSATWVTRTPLADSTRLRGRVLLIDNVPTTNAASSPNDGLYNQAMNRNVPAADRAVLRLQTNRPFRSEEDLYQTLAMYDVVVWYRGTEAYLAGRDTNLVRQSGAVTRYVSAGGQFYFESLDMIVGEQIQGILSKSFLNSVLDCDSLHRFKPANADQLSEKWTIASGSHVFRSAEYAYNDSLRSTQTFGDVNGNGNLRGFAPRDTHNVAIWARAGNLAPVVSYDIPIGLRVSYGSGRIVAIAAPLLAMNGFSSSGRFLDKVLTDLLSAPTPSFARSTHRSMPPNRGARSLRSRR